MKIFDIRRKEKIRKPKKVFSVFGVKGILAYMIFAAMLFSFGSTLSYFTDVEVYVNNFLQAALLDFDLTGNAWLPAMDVSDLDPGETVSRDITVVDDDSISFKYKVYPVITGGDLAFCGQLSLTAMLEGVQVYSGGLISFVSDPVAFGPDGDNWTFHVSLPSSASSSDSASCEFDFAYEGWQTEYFFIPGGFHDTENISNSISEVGVSCNDNDDDDEDGHDGDENKDDEDKSHDGEHGGEASLNSSYENHELGDGDNDNNHDDNQCKEDDHDENENNDHGNNDKDKKDEHDSPSADNASNVSKPPHDEIQNQNQNELNNRIDNLDIPDAVNIPIIENPTSPDLNSNTSINVESTEPEPSASVATENN